MKKNYLEKTKLSVSTVIIVAVLTLMLTACNNKTESNTNGANLTPNNDSVTASNDIDKSGTDSEIQDGEYDLYVSLSGGSGKATIKSPTKAKVIDGTIALVIEWSSSNYDYMIVGEDKLLPINDEGNSVFEIPIDSLDGEITVIADTVAMSKPHEIEYAIRYSRNNSDNVGDDTADSNKTSNNEIVNTKVEDEEVSSWIENHKVTGKLEREYAERFGVSYYDNKYCMVVINGTDYYMLNGDEFSIPNDIPKGVTVIDVPLKNIDLVSTSTVDYFACLDALDGVSFTSIKQNDSVDEKVTNLIAQDKIKYAGKYSAPDYELLLSGGCSLVVENTMITHTPDVLLQLHNIDIPTLIDYSSHEPSPIGRMEWIKLYGLLSGKLKEAEQIFEEKASNINSKFEKNDKKVAYFYVSENGGVGIRKNQDYIVKLIDIAGGNYAFDGKNEYDGTGQMTIQKEAFFTEISDCDVLIYNSTINGGVTSKDELLSKFEIIGNTKAFKNDSVYCTRDNIYLSVMSLPEIADELNVVLCGGEASEYFYKLK